MLHFYKTPGILPLLTSSLTWSIPTDKKELYLTFDDGPIPDLTPYVLDQLDAYKAKATFFCVGDNIRKHPDIAADLISRGHVIGNHTFNHFKGWNVPYKDYVNNVKKCDLHINEVQKPKQINLFRPPHGQLTWRLTRALKREYKVIMWDVLAYDFDQSHAPQKSLKHTINRTSKGSIIVFHDNYKAEDKLKYMLPRYLEHFSEQGFSFKKLSLGQSQSEHN